MPAVVERQVASFMGREIGTCKGWTQIDSFDVVFLKFQPNDLGKAFTKNFDFSNSPDFSIDTESGDIAAYAEDGSNVTVDCDWSVFNRE